MHTHLPHLLLTLGAAFCLVGCDKTPAAPVPTPGPGAGRNLVLPPGITNVRVLAQNWSDEEAARYYNTPQGSQMLPYDWFLKLEQAASTTPFNVSATFHQFGYLPRSPGSGNPDGLPVGFAKNGVHIGLTCAACHTGVITVKDTAFIIDGGPTLSDAPGLMAALEAAMQATLADEAKFTRFATAILGATGAADPAKHARLKADFTRVAQQRSEYNHRNFPHGTVPGFGPGRIDAFGAILNEVAVRFAQVKDAKTLIDAPVSFPFLWDTPQHDKVQWNGSVANTVLPLPVFGTRHVGALGRNVGEVLGVFGDVDTTLQETPFGGYPSSVSKDNLNQLENLVRTLWSPEWPRELAAADPRLAINETLRAKGEVLYRGKANCISCHALIDRKDPNREIKAVMRAVGTDQTMARNIVVRESSSGIFKDRRLVQTEFPQVRRLGPIEPVSKLLSHVGARVLIGGQLVQPEDTFIIQHEIHAEVGEGAQRVSMVLTNAEVSGGSLRTAEVRSQAVVIDGLKQQVPLATDLKDLAPRLAHNFKLNDASTPDGGRSFKSIFTADAAAPVKFEYKARPLNGIWATAPYLHNGSVRTLQQLLSPSERQAKFQVGSTELDPVEVGLANAGPFTFDTAAQPGNSNQGHEYGADLDKDERLQLVEYLKSL